MSTKPRVKPPAYTTYDPKRREEFLSELGNITPAQRDLFHALCERWQPEISFTRFLSHVAPLVKNSAHELENLLRTLRARGCGLLTYKDTEAGQTPEKIILTAPNDVRFFHFRILHEFERFCARPSGIVPLESWLRDQGAVPPAGISEDLGGAEAGKAFRDGGDQTSYRIYRIPLEDDAVYLIPGWGTRFVNACLSRLRDELKNEHLVTEIAAMVGKNTSEIRNHVDSKDPLFWLEVSKTVLSVKADPARSRRAAAEDGAYQTASVLARFIELQRDEVRRRKEEKEDRDRDLEALALQVKSQRDTLVSPDMMSALIRTVTNKYVDDAEEVRTEFRQRYLEPRDAGRLPVILGVGPFHVHIDNFYPFFAERFDILGPSLAVEYARIMDAFLRSRAKDRVPVFLSRELLETDMLGRIRDGDSFVAETLERPRMLAEGIIHHFKETRAAKDVREVRRELERYFRPDSMVLKNLSAIFGISSLALFEEAVGRLSFWRQLWLKITGKYTTYRDQFVSQAGRFTSTWAGDGPAPRRQPPYGTKEVIIKAPRKDPPGLRLKGHAGEHRGLQKPGIHVPRQYTKKETEAAWDQLRKGLKPK